MRRNMDVDLRDLERKARRGEPDAILAYGHALVRAGQVTPSDAELLDSLGPEAWVAWITPGAEWERLPESTESGDAYAELIETNCAECGGTGQVAADDDTQCALCEGTGIQTSYRRDFSVNGFAIRRRPGGSPVIVRTRCTVRDGDWGDCTRAAHHVGTPPAELNRAREIADTARSWVDYFGWVDEQGRDPLHEMKGLSRRDPDTTWRFEFEQEQARGRAGRTLIPGRVLVRRASRRQGRRWVSVPLGELPDVATDWLVTDGETVVLRDRRTNKPAVALVSGAQNLDEVRSCDKIVKDDEFLVTVETTISGGIVPPTVDEIREASRVQLQRATEDLAKAEQEVARLAALVHRCARCESVIYQDDLGSWIDSTGGDGCEDGVHAPAQGERTPWGTFAGVPDAVFCDACDELPAETLSEHGPNCSLRGSSACALHHTCDEVEDDEVDDDCCNDGDDLEPGQRCDVCGMTRPEDGDEPFRGA